MAPVPIADGHGADAMTGLEQAAARGLSVVLSPAAVVGLVELNHELVEKANRRTRCEWADLAAGRVG